MIPIRSARSRVFLGGALGILLVACGGEEPVREFRVGLLPLMSERYVDASGVPSVRGAELAAEQINAAGGVVIDGIPHVLRLVTREHDEAVEEVTSAARMLINLDSVHVLVGPQLSRHAIPVGGVANDARVPMISPMSSNPETTRGRPYVFRLAFLDQAQGEALARYARQTMGIDRIGTLVDVTDPYSRDLSRLFREVFEELGGSVTEEPFTGGEPASARDALRALAVSDPDRVLLPIRSADMLEVMRISETEGLELAYLGTDTWSLEAAEAMASSDAAVVSHQWHMDLPIEEAVAFVRLHEAEYGDLPRATAALTYDAVHLVARAAESAGTLDGLALRDALAQLPPYHGASGTIHFRGSGDPARSVVLSTFEGGKARFHALVHPR